MARPLRLEFAGALYHMQNTRPDPWSCSFGGADILRVDPASGTVRVNHGPVVRRDVTDLAGDGKAAPKEHLERVAGGTIKTVGVGYGGFGVSVTEGPDGVSYGVGYTNKGFSIGVSCGPEGECSSRVGYSMSGNYAGGSIYIDSETGVGASVNVSTVNSSEGGSGVGAGYDTETGGSVGLVYKPPPEGGNAGDDEEGKNDEGSTGENADQSEELTESAKNEGSGDNGGSSGNNSGCPCNIGTGSKC